MFFSIYFLHKGEELDRADDYFVCIVGFHEENKFISLLQDPTSLGGQHIGLTGSPKALKEYVTLWRD
jgi:hypothetical protein